MEEVPLYRVLAIKQLEGNIWADIDEAGQLTISDIRKDESGDNPSPLVHISKKGVARLLLLLIKGLTRR